MQCRYTLPVLAPLHECRSALGADLHIPQIARIRQSHHFKWTLLDADSLVCCRRESALEFLESGFPEHEVPFLRDMLAELCGDANAVTTKLLEMRADAEAHRIAAEMEDLRDLGPAPDQVLRPPRFVSAQSRFCILRLCCRRGGGPARPGPRVRPGALASARRWLSPAGLRTSATRYVKMLQPLAGLACSTGSPGCLSLKLQHQ